MQGEWVDQLTDDEPDVLHVIEGSRKSYGDDMGAFLCFMGVRLLEMRRVLADTGSIYLHCDPTASHYLKELMDAIFGHKNFRNEIVWHYGGTGAPKFKFPAKHDLILFYARSRKATFHPLMTPSAKTSGWTGRDEKRMDSVWKIKGIIYLSSRRARMGDLTLARG